jgi:hypothetical protein
MNQPSPQQALSILDIATQPANSVNLSREDMVNCHQALIVLQGVVKERDELICKLDKLQKSESAVPSSPE